MPANETLLSRIAQRHTVGREDVATDALAFILERSPAARSAFADFLGAGEPGAAAITEVRTRPTLSGGAAPDLECRGEGDKVLAFMESKFWAELTPAQPVAYWEALPAGAPATLLFLAPPYRVNRSSLWDDLTGRLNRAGHALDITRNGDGLKVATGTAQNSGRRLMLATWGLLLNRLAQVALNSRDWQATFEIAELQGLANSVITGDASPSDDGFKNLISDVVKDVVASGWGDTKGLGPGAGGRYLRLAGAYAWFGVDFKQAKLSNRPLWLAFGNFGGDPGQVTTEQVGRRLGDEGQPGLEWRKNEVWVPIALPAGADLPPDRLAVADELKRIALLIDPAGPTCGSDPLPNNDHKSLIRDVVDDVVASGWGDTKGFSYGDGSGYHTRYLMLAGAFAGLGTDDNARKEIPDKPLILSFQGDQSHRVSLDEVRRRLGDEGQPGLGRRKNEVWVPIALPSGADLPPDRLAVAEEIKRIARLIDPDGPTYKKDAPNG